MTLIRVWKNNAHLLPRYAHDCEKCIFLGRVGDKDIWLHTNDVHENDHVIYRTSSEGQDYGGLDVKYARSCGPAWETPVELADQCYQSNYAYDVVEWTDTSDDVWAWREDYELVVGLYEDIYMKVTEKNAFFRDQHGNAIGIAKLDCVETSRDDQFAGCRFAVDNELEGIPDQFRVVYLDSRKAVMLYVMWVLQMIHDAGY